MTAYTEQDEATQQLLYDYNTHVNAVSKFVKDLLTIDKVNIKIMNEIDETNLPYITERFKELSKLANSLYESYTLANELYRDQKEIKP